MSGEKGVKLNSKFRFYRHFTSKVNFLPWYFQNNNDIEHFQLTPITILDLFALWALFVRLFFATRIAERNFILETSLSIYGRFNNVQSRYSIFFACQLSDNLSEDCTFSERKFSNAFAYCCFHIWATKNKTWIFHLFQTFFIFYSPILVVLL